MQGFGGRVFRETYFSPVSKDSDQTCQSNSDESLLQDSGELVDFIEFSHTKFEF